MFLADRQGMSEETVSRSLLFASIQSLFPPPVSEQEMNGRQRNGENIQQPDYSSPAMPFTPSVSLWHVRWAV